MLFNTDFDILVWQNMPVLLREPEMYAWLKALLAPIRQLYALFVANRLNNLYILAHSGQVALLEGVLNDTFDSANRGIYITDGPHKDAIYTYRIVESKPLYVGRVSENVPVYGYKISESTAVGVQFIVHVPGAAAAAVGYSEVRLRSLVNKYRLASRGSYSVVLF